MYVIKVDDLYVMPSDTGDGWCFSSSQKDALQYESRGRAEQELTELVLDKSVKEPVDNAVCRMVRLTKRVRLYSLTPEHWRKFYERPGDKLPGDEVRFSVAYKP